MSPESVMEKFTISQLVMCHNRRVKCEMDFAEVQGAIVCSMLAGKYKKPKEFDLSDLEAMGKVTEGVAT